MAANTSWAALGKATDLRNRILFTLGLLYDFWTLNGQVSEANQSG